MAEAYRMTALVARFLALNRRGFSNPLTIGNLALS
jgi:hypothetical protein